MQKLCTLFLTLSLAASLSAQHEPIQPFEQDLGVKVKILTLSNGTYQETFPNDSLLRIGSVVYNQYTGEVVTVIENDTLYGENNLKPEVVSRWLSPDPLAAKHPNSSPYTFTLDNPIVYTDPDGRDAILIITPGQNGQNGTIIVILTFNYDKNEKSDFETPATGSFRKTWGNGKAEAKGNMYEGNPFVGVEIDGQKYDITYRMVLNPVDNTGQTPTEGTNNLTIIPDKEKDRGSKYSEGELLYRASQEIPAESTDFGHELSHVVGIGHNDNLRDKDGNLSISAGHTSDRQVIMQDVINSVQGAVRLVNGSSSRSVVTLITDRKGSGLNTINLKGSNRDNIRSAQYRVIENQTGN